MNRAVLFSAARARWKRGRMQCTRCLTADLKRKSQTISAGITTRGQGRQGLTTAENFRRD